MDLGQNDGGEHDDAADILPDAHLLLEDDRAGNDGEHALQTEQDGDHSGVGALLGQNLQGVAHTAGEDAHIQQGQGAAENGGHVHFFKDKHTDGGDDTGASPRSLGVPGEEALVGKGVHYCAACDGAPYRGKTVTVVGGGNSAAADALALSRIAKKVYLIHRRDSLRATKVYHEPLMNAPNVEFCWNSTVSALLHESRLTGLRLQDVNTGAERELACDGVFISVGRAPATELFREELALDKSGYIIADESTRTSIPGVFAVGDVRTKALRQVVTAVSDGAVAVHYAEEYLAENR